MKKNILLLLSLISLSGIAMEDNKLKLKWSIEEIVYRRGSSEEQDIAEMRKIIEQGFNINANHLAGFTTLHYAVLRGKINVCKFLVEQGANPHIANCDGKTALQLADEGRKNSELVKILKSSKCNIYRPGMNFKKGEEWVIRLYCKRHGLKLEVGEVFNDDD